MHIETFVFNPFYENTYIIYNDQKHAIIIDPGCYEKYEEKEITEFISENQLTPKLILNTHCHIDHVLGNLFLKEHYDIPLWIPTLEEEMLQAVTAYASGWGISGYQSARPDKLIDENTIIELGDLQLSCIFAPGHSPGHLMFYHKESNILIGGDVIFRESIGRTDLPGGNFETLENSIKTNVYSLPDQTTIYPGHGPITTVGYEKENNPFVKA
jgi:glyoxylase-like metal-dependent hydrolase (beta-lactamase superfamily II)